MEGKIYSEDLQNSDSVNTAAVCYLQPDTNKTSNKEAYRNFYKTDSIFSFRSPKGYFPSLFHNLVEQATAPLHFSKKQWYLTASAAEITYALVIIDVNIDDVMKVQKSRHALIGKASPFITNFGSRYGYGTVIAFGTISALCRNKKGVETSLLASQAIITSGIWVQLLKVLTGRERPASNDIDSKSVAGQLYGPFAQFDQDLATRKPGSSFDSFPSGHTATAFSIATVFAMQYKDIKAVPILSYSLASLVGISRLTEHRHWSSDVFTGALLGYVCGRQVVGHFNKSHLIDRDQVSVKSKPKAEFNLIHYGNQIGFSLTW